MTNGDFDNYNTYIYVNGKIQLLCDIYSNKLVTDTEIGKVFDYNPFFGLLKINRDMFPEYTLSSLVQTISQYSEGISVDIYCVRDFFIFSKPATLPLNDVKYVMYMSPDEIAYNKNNTSQINQLKEIY